MAENILKLKVDSTSYDQKIKRAKDGLLAMESACRKVGGTFEVVEKEELEFVKALGKMETQSKSVKGKIGELTAAFTDLKAMYNRLSDAEKQSPFGKAIATSLDQLKPRIQANKNELEKINKELGNGKKEADKFTGGLNLNIGSLTKWASALGAGKVALDVIKDAFLATETNLDAWGETLEATSSLYDAFVWNLNSQDFSGLLGHISEIIEASKKAYNAIDELETLSTVRNPERVRLESRMTELRAIIRTKGKDSAEGKAAAKELRSITPQYKQSIINEGEDNRQAFVSKVKERLAGSGIKLTDSEFNTFLSTFANERAFKNFRSHAAGAITTKVEGSGDHELRTTVDSRNKTQKLLDLFTDDWRKENEKYITAYYGARGRAASLDLQNSRYLKEGGTSGKGGSKTTKETYNEGEVGHIKEKIAELEKQLNHSTSAAMSDAINAQIGRLKGDLYILQGNLKFKVDTSDETGKELRKALEGEPMDLHAKLKADTEGLTSLLKQKNPDPIYDVADNYAMQKAREKYKPEEIDPFKDLRDSINTLSEGISALSQINSGLAQMGIELPGAVGDAINAISGLMNVAGGVMEVVEFANSIMGGTAITAETANTTATIANTAAMGALTGALAANTTSNFIPFHTGGLVHAAQGIFVPGSPNGGRDTIPAMLSPGELVLNHAQQNNIARELQSSGNSQNIRITGRIAGEDIILSTDHTNRRRGRSESAIIRG